MLNINDVADRQAVLDFFEVDNFRELSTEKAFAVTNKLADLKPEVAVKVLEQFPECANMVVNLAKSEIETAKHAMEQGDKSTQRNVDALNRIIGVIEKELEDECLRQYQKQFRGGWYLWHHPHLFLVYEQYIVQTLHQIRLDMDSLS